MKLKYKPLVCTLMTNAEHDMIQQQATHFKTYEIITVNQKETSKLKTLIKNTDILSTAACLRLM